MAPMESSSALDPFLRDAGRSLFEVLDLPTPSVNAIASPKAIEGVEHLMAVIGFVNEQMSGALCVTASRDAVRAIQPPEVRDLTPSDALLLDMITEFANMLLGRMKTLLWRRGIPVLLSTPTASIAEKLQISSPPTLGAVWYAFENSQGTIYARIALTIDPSLALGDSCSEAPEQASEGEMMML